MKPNDPSDHDMKIRNEGKSGPGMGSLLLVLAPVLCCGGIVLLPVILGSAGIAAITGIFLDPLAQGVMVIAGVLILFVLWKRIFPKTGSRVDASSSGSTPSKR